MIAPSGNVIIYGISRPTIPSARDRAKEHAEYELSHEAEISKGWELVGETFAQDDETGSWTCGLIYLRGDALEEHRALKNASRPRMMRELREGIGGW